MGNAAVDEVDFFDAAFEGLKGGLDLGNHAAGNGAVGDEFAGLHAGNGFNQGRLVLGVTEEPGNVGKVDELGGLESAGQGRRGDVGVDIVGFAAVFVSTEGRNDGDDSGAESGENILTMAVGDLADAADIDGVSVVIFAQELLGREDRGAVNRSGLASELVDGFDEPLIDFSVQGAVDNLDGFGRGDAESANEFRCKAGLFHGG